MNQEAIYSKILELATPEFVLELVANALDWSKISMLVYAKDVETGKVFATVKMEDGKSGDLNFS
jgi:hypothetical protein